MKKIITIIAMAAALASCTRTNPFLEEWNTPYGIPPFDKITAADYIPAIKAGIEQQTKEIEAITSNPDSATFGNTIAALELSGGILSKVGGVLYNLTESDNSPELEKVMEEAIPLYSEHESNINFNKALYQRVAAVYNADQSGLTREQQVVLKKIYDNFVKEGIGLSDEDQNKLREINSTMASKIQKIGNNILAENNAFKAEFGISISEYPTAMTNTEDRALREKMFKAYSSRCHNGGETDNRELILSVMDLRIQKAKILGFKNSASYTLSNKMAANTETVENFLAGIMKASVAKAKEEIKDMEAVAGFKIKPWDWWYYAEKVRKQKFDLDEELTKPYFKMENVVKGLFTCANMLYGINAEELKDVPVYNPEAKAFKITDADNSLVGILFTDYFPRSSKRGGAWMSEFRIQHHDADGKDIRPIIVNVGNLQKNLTVDEVQTAFHEFGHALHGLLSKCTYPSVAGTNVTRDFVEMFSQFNENWAFLPELLSQYAINDEGQVIPDELVAKITNSLKFNQGFMTTELCAASILDLKWHELESMDGIDVDSFEEKVCKEMGLIDEIIPRYRTTYFNHIFGSGYNTGYYGYLWAEVLDKDAFDIFVQNGTWNPELAKKFKETFLEKGGSEEPMVLFKSFAGREPDSKAFLRGRGLAE